MAAQGAHLSSGQAFSPGQQGKSMHSRIKLLLVSLLLCASSATASASEYVVKPVVYKDLVANLYLPSGVAKAPVVIAFGGSDGGLNGGDANGELLAPHGVAVLSLAYFKADGIPPTLDRIPMEYFIRAIDYLATVPAVDAGRIGVVSGSRGSEAALLLASLDARIKSVVVTTPSNVAWYGKTTPRSAWTLPGQGRAGLEPRT
jgi:dienelactone hydrolase